MKCFLTSLALFALAAVGQSALKPGDSLAFYEVKNTSGQTYCPICSLAMKEGKLVAFGKLNDEAFWSDLQQLQALAKQYSPKLGVFAQIIDSQDIAAVKAAAAKHGVKFPVVVPVEKDWDEKYQIKGVSRTILYAVDENKITWTGVGLEEETAKKLAEKLRADLAG